MKRLLVVVFVLCLAIAREGASMRPEAQVVQTYGRSSERALALQGATLADVYRQADLNRSGKLSYYEVMQFQEWVERTFRYAENATVLRPEEFLAEGQGDCDDFAVFTAGMLRFYRWEAYVGRIYNGNPREGHAVCLAYEAGTFPSELKAFRVTPQDRVPGAKAGAYVPIDYGTVGNLAESPYKHGILVEVYVPEELYGLYL